MKYIQQVEVNDFVDQTTNNSRIGCEKYLNERWYLCKLLPNERLVYWYQVFASELLPAARGYAKVQPLCSSSSSTRPVVAAAAVGQSANGPFPPEDDLPISPVDDEDD